MDTRILDYYNHELQYVRELGAEFAPLPEGRGTPGVGGHGLCQPLRERLLEGFAFLAARVHLKIDDQFPTFTQHLLEMVYPHYLAPTPSMAVVQFRPNLDEGSLAEGFVIPRQTALRGLLGEGEQTACEYRTAHEVTLWPLEIAKVEYFNRDAAPGDLPALPQVKACLQIRLRCTAGLNFHDLALEELPLYVGSSELAAPLYEQLLSNTVGIAARGTADAAAQYELLDSPHLQRVGFSDQEALLPFGPRSFQGYRLLHEYFAFRDRYFFVAVTGLKRALKRCPGNKLDVFILFDELHPRLDNAVAGEHLRLFCSPAINLFPKRSDRIQLDDHSTEHHVVPDRTRPLDFEVHSITSVTGHGTTSDQDQPFRAFYSLASPGGRQSASAFYTTRRQPRVVSSSQRRRAHGRAMSAAKSSCRWWTRAKPLIHTTCGSCRRRRCARTAICRCSCRSARPAPISRSRSAHPSNRFNASPDRLAPGRRSCMPGVNWAGDWSATSRSTSLAQRYRLGGTAAALQELLRLYADLADNPTRQQIDGLLAVSSQPVVRQHPTSRRMSFGRGLQIEVTFDEAAFHGGSLFLLGSVLDQFFARYVSINSFTETCIKTDRAAKSFDGQRQSEDDTRSRAVAATSRPALRFRVFSSPAPVGECVSRRAQNRPFAPSRGRVASSRTRADDAVRPLDAGLLRNGRRERQIEARAGLLRTAWP